MPPTTAGVPASAIVVAEAIPRCCLRFHTAIITFGYEHSGYVYENQVVLFIRAHLDPNCGGACAFERVAVEARGVGTGRNARLGANPTPSPVMMYPIARMVTRAL